MWIAVGGPWRSWSIWMKRTSTQINGRTQWNAQVIVANPSSTDLDKAQVQSVLKYGEIYVTNQPTLRRVFEEARTAAKSAIDSFESSSH
ncbi:hypothetical protein PBR20603_04286 [Pandoraea bronchicola]|uniref:Uncharacterized protein n=1 Tax=Pandoraea bronchicola TaxID=2508287 RepID=A0A5E5BXF4_9BURK|nr:hypothetical protein PBR20603_04286 [Pandoraea bronchicola]